MIAVGDRVYIADPGHPCCGEHATVTRGEHRGVLTGRTMVEARIDGQELEYDEGFYLDQIEPVNQFSLRAIS